MVLRLSKPTLMVWITLLLTIQFHTAFAAEMPAKKQANSSTRSNWGEINIARATWDTGWFQTEVFRHLLMRLGYNVAEARTMENESFYNAVAEGKMDLWANGWFPLHNSYLDQPEIENKVEKVGYEVEAGAIQGYMVDIKSARELEITSLADLKDPEIARRFDRDNNGKADLIGCNPGWGCEKIIEHHLDEYELRETVEHIQGDYSPMMANTVEDYRNGEPVLFYTWTPNWTVGKMVPGEDALWLNVPYSSLPADQQGQEERTTLEGLNGAATDPLNIGFPPNDIRSVANKKFLEAHPDIKILLEQVKIPLEDILAQNALLLQGEGGEEDLKRHAQNWIKRNKGQVENWLNEARKYQSHKQRLSERPDFSGAAEPKEMVRVVTQRLEPFVVYKDREYTGFSIDLWEEIARETNLDYRLYGVNSIAKLLDDVERGAAEVATAGIGITSNREQKLDFSHAFFESGLQIMVKKKQRTMLESVIAKIMAIVVSRDLLYILLFFLFILLLSAHIIWMVERDNNPDFPDSYVKDRKSVV